MTKEEFAASLHGRDAHRFDLTKEETKQAKAAGLAVVFGQSDDLMEFRGAIEDEVGAWDGVTAVLFKHKDRFFATDADSIGEMDNARQEVAAMDAAEAGNLVTAVWGNAAPEMRWLIKTALPHAPFDLMEDGEVYDRGLVLSLADLA
jgi:hypothetical protein